MTSRKFYELYINGNFHDKYSTDAQAVRAAGNLKDKYVGLEIYFNNPLLPHKRFLHRWINGKQTK